MCTLRTAPNLLGSVVGLGPMGDLVQDSILAATVLEHAPGEVAELLRQAPAGARETRPALRQYVLCAESDTLPFQLSKSETLVLEVGCRGSARVARVSHTVRCAALAGSDSPAVDVLVYVRRKRRVRIDQQLVLYCQTLQILCFNELPQ